MPDGHQGEFLFIEGWEPPSGRNPAAPESIDKEIAQVWRVPVGWRVRVELRGHDVPSMQGLLEIAAAPDFPFDSRRVLRLRIGSVEFTHRQIEAWVLLWRPRRLRAPGSGCAWRSVQLAPGQAGRKGGRPVHRRSNRHVTTFR
jgi:hypothetical protein